MRRGALDALFDWLKILSVLAAAGGGAGTAIGVYALTDSATHGVRITLAAIFGIVGALVAATPSMAAFSALGLLREIADNSRRP
jgi:hypothetical protein